MPEIVDPYLDPAAGILRNEVGAFTRADLASAEGALTFACDCLRRLADKLQR